MHLAHAISFQAQAQRQSASRCALGQLAEVLVRAALIAVVQGPASSTQARSILHFIAQR